MRQVEERAYAKINLTLDVLGLRPDGYHQVDMVMQSVSLWDDLSLRLEEEPGIRFSSSREDLPQDEGNLAVKAARCFLRAIDREGQGLFIRLQKRIPVCAGTAGGSSDAAAVLRGLNRLTGAGLSQKALMDLGEQLGSDVPYCVLGGTARAGGRGEELQALPPLPDCHIVLCKPDFPVSTPELFRLLDQKPLKRSPDTQAMLQALEQGNLGKAAGALYNVFEQVLPPDQQKQVVEIRSILEQSGARGTCMSGTGPTVFGLFEGAEEAQAASHRLELGYREVFLTRPV